MPASMSKSRYGDSSNPRWQSNRSGREGFCDSSDCTRKWNGVVDDASK